MLRKSQQGISMVSLMLLAPIVAVLVLVVLKLVPVYIEHASVTSVLKNMTGEHAQTFSTPAEVMNDFLKRIELNDVSSVGRDNISITRESGVYTIAVDYEVRVKLFYNLSMVATFSDQGEVPAI